MQTFFCIYLFKFKEFPNNNKIKKRKHTLKLRKILLTKITEFKRRRF